MEYDILKFFGLFWLWFIGTLPLTYYNIVYNGILHNNATEPFLSRQSIVLGIQLLIFFLILSFYDFHTLAMITFTLGLLLTVCGFFTHRAYNKQLKLEIEKQSSILNKDL